MRSFLAATAVAGLVASGYAADVLTAPPMGVYKTAYNIPAVTATTLIGVPLATDVTLNHKRDLVPVDAPVPPSRIMRRGLSKRDDACVPQPTGIGYTTSPDEPNAFQKDSYYSNAANNAITPSGYTLNFSNIVATNNAANYQGFTFLDSYDVSACAGRCNSQDGCASFNIYFERDPVLSPDPNLCPNPASLTRVKCVWWGGLVSLNNANNYGQTMASFYVVIAGNNGYINNARAAAIQAAATSTQQAPTATETAKTGSVWLVYYSADTSQSSYSNTQASSSEADCQLACDADASCNAYTYVGGQSGIGSGTCWLKSQLGKPTSSNNNVVSGTRVVDAGAGSAGSSSSSSSSSATAHTTASTVSFAAPVQKNAASTSSSTNVVIDQPVYGTQANDPVYITTTSYSPPATSAVITTPRTTARTTVSTTASTTNSTIASTTASTTASTAPSTTAAQTTAFVTSAVATTTSAAAKATNFIIRVGPNQWTESYAYLDPNGWDSLRYITDKSKATVFTLDSQGNLKTVSSKSGSVANVALKGGVLTGTWQRIAFKSLSSTSNNDVATCSMQDPYIVCTTSAGFVFAGGCLNNGYLYFGLPNKIPWGCGWTGLYPVYV